MAGILTIVESSAARALAYAWYACAVIVCRVFRPRRPNTPATGRILVTGTFHNPGWFVSHLTPLARCGFREVMVVSHGSLPRIDGVRVLTPPSWLTRVGGRTMSKAVWTIYIGIRMKPDLFMGYHVIPNSTTSLIAARLVGRPACYQMTSGPIELEGGGFRCSENPILRRFGRPSRRVERLAMSVVREFDLVVVRGKAARHFAQEVVGCKTVEIVPGSVDLAQFSSDRRQPRSCDAVFVGQVVSRKQPMLFVEAVHLVQQSYPNLRAALVGDGPLMPEVRRRVADLGLEHVLTLHGQSAEVRRFLAGSKVFVLPSRNEGLSIAMAEAMISGAVPVVANVGDLGDLVRNDETGYLVDGDDPSIYADRILRLLRDVEHWQRLSSGAMMAARAYNGLEGVTELWRRYLRRCCAEPQRGTSTRPARGRPIRSSSRGASKELPEGVDL